MAAAEKEARKSTGCSSVRHGGKLETRTALKMGADGQHVGGRLEVAKRHHVASSESNCRRSHFCPSDGGTRKSTKAGVCQLKAFGTVSLPMFFVWSSRQVDPCEEMEPVHEMYGTLDAELEVQHTMERAELTVFLCLLGKAIGPTMSTLTTEESLMGCGGEKRGALAQKRWTPICGS